MTQSKHDSIEISIVIPCYGSAQVLPELIKRIIKEMESRRKKYEIILVNDCSPDNLEEISVDLVNAYPAIRYIELMHNVGQYRATMCGFAHARGRFVVTMDDDLQHPPEEIYKLIDRIYNDIKIDAVFGAYESKKHSFVRNIGSSFISFINKIIFHKPPNLHTSAFRCLRHELVEALLLNQTRYPVLGPLILKTTHRIVNVAVKHNPRRVGKSSYSTIKLLRTMLDNILNFSSLPLQIISIAGVSIAILSFLLSLILIIIYIVKGSGVPGWTSIFLIINFYAGLILLALGIIGEYLIRILGECKGEPLFLVRRKIDGENFL